MGGAPSISNPLEVSVVWIELKVRFTVINGCMEREAMRGNWKAYAILGELREELLEILIGEGE